MLLKSLYRVKKFLFQSKSRIILAGFVIIIFTVSIFSLSETTTTTALENAENETSVQSSDGMLQQNKEGASSIDDVQVLSKSKETDNGSTVPETNVSKSPLESNEILNSGNAGSNPTVGMPAGILMRKVDVGPGSDSFGHKPVTSFKKWPGGSVIKEGVIPRDDDGWLRISGYEFSGATKLETGNVIIKDSRFLPGNQSGTITGDKCSYYPAMLYSSSTPPPGELVLDHVSIDQGNTGWSMGGIVVYMKTTVRYSYIVGPRTAVMAMSNSLYEHNYLEGTKAGTECNKNVFNGIKGNYQKVNWTARHNTIISYAGITSQENLWAASCIHNDVNGNGDVKISYGILVENNYCNGFRWGVVLDGTDPNRKNLVRNNFFGTDFVNNGSNRIDMSTLYPHSIVENNNVVNMDFIESIGSVRPATVGLLPELSL